MISVDGTEIFAECSGAPGKPWLTCLHSLATDHRLWDPQLAALQTGHRVLRLDLRGHGRSQPGDGDYTVAGLARDVVSAWDRLGIETSAVMGLSLGGMIALALAIEEPQRVERVIAADCRTDAPDGFKAMWQQRRALLNERGMAAVADVTLPTWFTPQTLSDTGSAAAVARVRDMIESTSAAGYIGATRALERLDVKPGLPRIGCPALLVVGAQDGVHPAAMREMATEIPGPRLVEIQDAAHLSNIEQPLAFEEAVLAFLNDRAGR